VQSVSQSSAAEERQGKIYTKNRQFWLIGDDWTSLTDLDFDDSEALATCSPDLVAVCSEGDYVPVEVDIRVHRPGTPEQRPNADRCDAVTVTFTAPAHLMESDGQLPDDPELAAFTAEPGTYKVQVCRSVNADSSGSYIDERFSIDLWSV
jgi:hypothetical protein